MPLEANLDKDVEEGGMYKKLLEQKEKSPPARKVKSPPSRTVKSPPSRKVKSLSARKMKSPPKKVKEHVTCSNIDVDVGLSNSVPANGNGIKPDVVIEVEEGEAAKERGHVIIAIDNPNPELEVQIVVSEKKLFQLD